MAANDLAHGLRQKLSAWQDEESDLLRNLESIEEKFGFIPRDLSDQISKLLEVKLDRLERLQGKVQSGAQKEVEHLIAKWKEEEGNLIMILHEIQNEHGYIPRDVAMELSRALNVKLARIYEVITFYHYFKLVPPGKHNISVCLGTACYLKGSESVLDGFKRKLRVKEGETTEDRMFHLEAVRCIGCCGLAPAVVVDGRTMARTNSRDVAQIIADVREAEEKNK